MADNRYDDSIQQGQPLKKADLILQYDKELSAKTEEILRLAKQNDSNLQVVLGKLGEGNSDLSSVMSKGNDSIKQEIKYLAVQNASVFESLSEKVQQLQELIESGKIAQKEDEEPQETKSADIDYDLLADKIAERMPAPRATGVVAAAGEPIDYDILVDKLIARLPVQETAAVAPVAAQPAEIDYDYLADKLASRLPAQEAAVASATPIPMAVSVSEPAIDYDYLAQKVAALIPVGGTAENVRLNVDADDLADRVVSRIPLQDAVSPDYIASRVAEQLVIPRAQAELDVDYEALAEKVADKLQVPSAVVDNDYIAEKVSEKINAVAVDNDYIAEKVAERISNGNVDSEYIANKVAEQIVLPEARDFDYDYLAQKVAEQIPATEVNNAGAVVAPVNYDINEDELADAIALKVGSLKPEDFEILVDDEGCNSLAKEVAAKLDYELISNTVAEKLRASLVEEDGTEPDYEEMANRISEKITVAGVNEDAIADKAAAVLSNYLPEYDSDEIADKVAEQVISAMPTVDHETLTENISAKLMDNDYEIVLDEDGIKKVSDSVSVKVHEDTEERFDAIDREIAEIKELLLSGKLVAVSEVVEEKKEEEEYEEPYVVEEALVTVSDLINDTVEEPEEEQVEEEAEEITEEVIEEPAEEPEEVVEEVEEQPEEPQTADKDPIVIVAASDDDEEEDADSDVEEGEESEEGEGGVDFANMMRYNRSFIARIIQSTDEQKSYYGEVRSTLLSYKKVNSNIAWGAERFHKGRETIARFKIRGKTLVLYLALDPATHEVSVYHHKDVSSNKSLHGTPMMVKIKSPRGVKKAIRLIDEMLEARGGIKRDFPQRDYAAMYPYESIEELIEDGLVKDVNKK